MNSGLTSRQQLAQTEMDIRFKTHPKDRRRGGSILRYRYKSSLTLFHETLFFFCGGGGGGGGGGRSGAIG